MSWDEGPKRDPFWDRFEFAAIIVGTSTIVTFFVVIAGWPITFAAYEIVDLIKGF